MKTIKVDSVHEYCIILKQYILEIEKNPYVDFNPKDMLCKILQDEEDEEDEVGRFYVQLMDMIGPLARIINRPIFEINNLVNVPFSKELVIKEMKVVWLELFD